ALGYNQINLWGGSYGTRLGLEVMRLYPAGLRSVVLDAVYPPDVDLYLESPANLDRSLELLFVSCAANAVCNQKFPDLRTVFYQTIERLEVSPQMRTIEDPFSGVEYQALMDGDTLLSLVFQVLYESRLRYLLPELIYDASRGEFETFDKMRGVLVGQMDLSSRGMMFSVQCHEELAFSTLAELEEVMEAYPHLARMYEYAIVGKLPFFACDLWSAGMAPSSANQPVQSDIPTLLMAGEFDPITPPSWAFQAAETLENGYVFEYPGIGHGATAVAGCSRDMMLVFLNNPGRAPDNGCISEMSH
ncbi:alpha/beta hydrolase, partial [Chloroflexota bacterium]